MKMVISSVLSLVTLLTWCGTAQAEVYRWTDENGKVHFGDRPPGHVDAETLDMPESRSSPAVPAVTDEQRLERHRRLVEALEEERKLKEQEKQEQKEKEEKLAAYCQRLLGEVKDSERINRYYRYNEQGERTYMSDDEADSYREKIRSTYEKRCQ
ncbi:MAG: DUF4124 domain-containing protein [Ketobacteraceae bacterium]|nr:DUF4124 domain-containing protein [Ketobacteraceae bacterium]